MFVLCCCNYSWKLSVHQKSGFSGDRILKRSQWSLAKRHLKQGGQIVGLIFLYGNSGDSNIIFSDVFFAYNAKEIQHG